MNSLVLLYTPEEEGQEERNWTPYWLIIDLWCRNNCLEKGKGKEEEGHASSLCKRGEAPGWLAGRGASLSLWILLPV